MDKFCNGKKSVKEAFPNDNNNGIDWLKFPYEIKNVDDKINKEMLNDFRGERTGFLQVGPKKWFFLSGYKKNAEIYYNLQPRQSDVWVITFPRSGTTWMQELVWLLANNLYYETAFQKTLDERFPFLEMECFAHPEVIEEVLKENSHSEERCTLIRKVAAPTWKSLVRSKERRFIKTHLPFELLPPDLLKVGCKIIYVARNPKDVTVSYYHLDRSFRTKDYIGDFPKYWKYFQNDLQPWGPYWSHVQAGWERRNENNFLFMFYEDMIKDLKKCILRVSDFLGVSYTNKQYEILENHLKIENFRNNKSVNLDIFKDLGIIKKDEPGYVRNGKSGGWKDYFTGDLNREADKWMEENTKKIQIKFPNVLS